MRSLIMLLLDTGAPLSEALKGESCYRAIRRARMGRE